MTDPSAPRLALSPTEAAVLVRPDDPDLVVQATIPATFIEAVARRVAEILAEDDSRAPGEYLAVKEAADRLGVHENTIRRAIKDGRLDAVKVGQRGAWRIEASALDRLIRVSPATSVLREGRGAKRRRTPSASVPSFAARARAQNRYNLARNRSTKEVT
jgi:excisionase family DNA binding protein